MICGVLNVNWWKGKSESIVLCAFSRKMFFYSVSHIEFTVFQYWKYPNHWVETEMMLRHAFISLWTCVNLLLFFYQLICLIWINTLANNSTETHLNDNMTSNMQIKCLTSEWNSYFHVFTHRGNLCLPI